MCEHAEESSLGHAEAMFEIADAVTQCKFEASDKDTDEVVLYKILQVMSRNRAYDMVPLMQQQFRLQLGGVARALLGCQMPGCTCAHA